MSQRHDQSRHEDKALCVLDPSEVVVVQLAQTHGRLDVDGINPAK